jgi:hypothetical protein
MTTTSSVRIYDRAGNFLAELNTPVTRTWERNKYGEASFQVAYNDQKFRPEYFAWGNLLYIRTANLPDWGGVLDKSRDWGQDRCTFNAYSAEYLFNMRTLEDVISFDSNSVEWNVVQAPAGVVFVELIRRSNLLEDTLISAGNVWGGGPQVKVQGGYVKIASLLQDLLDISANDYNVTPYLNVDLAVNGVLKFRGNWYQQLLSFRSTTLREGYNMSVKSSSNFVEYPPKVNRAIAYGNSGTLNDKVTAVAQDLASIGKNRLRQDCVSIASNDATDAVTAATSAIAMGGNGKQLFDVSALNVDNTFLDLGIGCVLPVQFVTYGFGRKTMGRVVRMQYTDGDESVDITCEEYIP